jgi:hypothetical protein
MAGVAVKVVQHALQLGLNLLPAVAPGAGGGGLARALEEIAPLVVVQVEDAGDDVQHRSGRLHTALRLQAAGSFHGFQCIDSDTRSKRRAASSCLRIAQ